MRWRPAVPLLAAVLAAVAGGGCSGNHGGDLGAFCATAERFAVDNPASALDRYDPADPAAAAGLLRTAAGQLQAWADEAPGEVDDDVELIAESMGSLADEFESPGAAPASALQDQVEAVEAASGRVVGFTRQNCQVDLDPATTLPAATVPPAD